MRYDGGYFAGTVSVDSSRKPGAHEIQGPAYRSLLPDTEQFSPVLVIHELKVFRVCNLFRVDGTTRPACSVS